MSSEVRIPAPLRRLTNGQDKITAEGDTVQEIIDFLEQNFPNIKSRICNEDGDEISIVPAVAGGSIN